MDSEFFSPLRESLCFAMKGDDVVVAFVVALFFHGRPAAVARLVVPVVVGKAVDAMPKRRARSHIAKEIGKSVRPSPAVANRNAATTPFLVSSVFRVIATLKHFVPSGMFWRTNAANTVAMFHGSCTGKFPFATSARLAFAIDKALGREGLDNSACAATKKLALGAARKYDWIGFPNDNQSLKMITRFD